MQDTIILSIWKFDPIGGEYVDWPDDLEAAQISDSALSVLRRELSLGSNHESIAIRSRELLSGLWITHGQLQESINECSMLIDRNLRSSTSERSLEALCSDILKVVNALKVAQGIDGAGLLIG